MPFSYGTRGAWTDVIAPLALALFALLLPFSAILAAYVVTGQAHFLMAYRYQWKGGRMTRRYALAALALGLLALAYFLFHASFAILLLIAGPLFAAHYAYDEFTLHGDAHDARAWLLVAGFAALFLALVLGMVFPAFMPGVAFGILTLVYGAARFFSRLGKPVSTERYVWLVAALLMTLSLAGLPYQALGIVILLHVFDWYVGYGNRVRGNAARARAYWKEVTLWLALLGALFAAYLGGTQALAVLFAPAAYYLWAVAHIVLSVVASLARVVPKGART